MGSAKVTNAKPQTMENNKFKAISLIKLFFHKDKKKEKAKENELILKKNEPKHAKNTVESAETTVASILEPFRKLELKANDKSKTIKVDVENENELEDELDNFTFKVIEEDRRSPRIDSQSSQDSGFSDINPDVIENLEKLSIQDKTDAKDKERSKEHKTIKTKEHNTVKEHKKEANDGEEVKEERDNKKKRLVVVKRAPTRGNRVNEYSVHPYAKDADKLCKPINQINQKCLSGGQLIVNQPAESELDEALQSVANLYQSNPPLWDDLLDVINNDCSTRITPDNSLTSIVPDIPIYEPNIVSNIEEFSFADAALLAPYPKHDIFPTPPRSDVPSPLSESQTFYPSNSEYTLSPERSSPTYNSDFEKYQEISPYSYEEEEMKRDRTSSVCQSSMTMKNFKDLQKEIANTFSKKECCDINRKPCKEIFEEHLSKLKGVEKRNLILKVSKLDLKTAYGVIHHIFLSLSKEASQLDLQMSLFALVCQRVLAETPAVFVGDFGLSFLKAAALRCPQYPLLTRYIVECVYLVLAHDPKLCANECVFHERLVEATRDPRAGEYLAQRISIAIQRGNAASILGTLPTGIDMDQVDAQGDNLVIACARGGDTYALVLSEITRSDARAEAPPLFRLHHSNSDGYNALHMACRLHSASNPRLHTVHVLLDHANADIWKGDIKGGDSALHLAVNSSTCDLRLVMLLFRNQDRKLWKKLAHKQNMSSVTPLEYARSAAKSTSRQNYPHEVLDFLKKCR